MKSIKFILAAVVLVAAVAGCRKMETPNESKLQVEVNFTVADRADFGVTTKAVKTSWAAGDSILVLFKPETAEGYLDDPNRMYLVYNGTEWEESWGGNGLPSISAFIKIVIQMENKGEGVFVAIHHRGKVEIQDGRLSGYKGGEFMSCAGAYTCTMGSGSLIFDMDPISMELDPKLYQVSIDEGAVLEMMTKDNRLSIFTKGIMSSAYTLSEDIHCSRSTLLSYDLNEGEFVVAEPEGERIIGPGGVINGEDLSFVFYSTASGFSGIANKYYKFQLASIRSEVAGGVKLFEYEAGTGKIEPGKAVLLPNVDSWVEVEE